MLHLAMHKVQAWERLSDPRYSGALSADGLYRLLLQAGVNEEEANDIANARANARLDDGEMA